MDPIFAVAAGLSVGAGLMVVTRRNPVHGALWMLLCFLALAAVYLRIGAPFLAALHVLIYTGAILVLFVFVIFLLPPGGGEGEGESRTVWPLAAALTGAALFVLLSLCLLRMLPTGRFPESPSGFGGVETVGRDLFGRHLLPFELISVLLLAAVFASVMMARRKP